MLSRIKKLSRWQLFICFFFLIIFLIGLISFRAYGIADDERIERNHDLVTHYYLKSIFKGNFKPNGNPIWDVNRDPLEKLVEKEKIERRFFQYEYRYYGVAIQLPLATIEQAFHYSLDISIIYSIRHLYTFLLFFISLIYFYRLLKSFILKNEKWAFMATLFLILSPRIYGDSFYNIKDLVFMSSVIVNIYYSFIYLKNPNLKNLFLLCFISALAINCRVIGGFIILLTLIFKLVTSPKNKLEMGKDFFKIFLLTYMFYILLTPASWNNIIKFPFNAIDFFFNYSDPYSHKIQECLYFGKNISSKTLPWHYLPVWIFITTPFMYTILSFIGFGKEIMKVKLKKIDKEWLFCNIILVFMLAMVMIFRPTLYTGWRHFYFLYPIIIINATVGLKWLLDINKKYQKFIVCIIIINCIYIVGWMIDNHPYQYEYFELFFRKYSIENFNTNYWGVSNNDAMKYIADNTKTKVKVYPELNVSYFWLNQKDRRKIQLAKNIEDADYIIDNSKDSNKNYKKKYKEITYKKIDGYRLYTIYKK